MKQEEYVKARIEEAKGKKQPSKDHKQPIVIKEPQTGKTIYREEQ